MTKPTLLERNADREGREVMEQETDYTIWDAVKRLDARLDKLKAQDWKGLMAHLHTMWHDLERRFDKLERQVGKNYEHLRGGIFEVHDKANALAERVAELEGLVGWYAGYPRRVDREPGATASSPVPTKGKPRDMQDMSETIACYIELKIHEMFLAVAEMVSQGTTAVSQEESAGIPMKLFQGETLLMNVWKQYVEAEGLKGEVA